MEINQAKYFMAIVEHGTFRNAAEHLFISQPALTKSIQKLEEELGVLLFERKGVHIELTQPGKMFIPYCSNLLNTMDSGIRAVKEAAGAQYGHISMAVSSEVFIKHLIYDHLRDNPDVSISCQLMSNDEMVHGLEQGSLDFIISENKVVADQIKWEQIYSGGLTALLNKDDPLIGRKEINMEELKDRYFCIGHIRSNIVSHIFNLCRGANFEPKIRYLGYDPDLSGMLLDLPGSVIISSDSIDKCLKTTSISPKESPDPIRIKGTNGTACMGIAYKPSHYRSKAADNFMNFIRDYFNNL
ncbi:MAG: LysR family transcriptional regulator [Eubacterium sp.]|nr:LysR family transcriptional regulator [Eubacterium sp.]